MLSSAWLGWCCAFLLSSPTLRPPPNDIFFGGKIVETGGPELAAELHKRGYERIRAAYPEAAASEQAMATSKA